MLTDADRELVSAAVDGELTPVTGPAFRTLVAQSADAVALYQTLTAQARRLAALPRHPAPADVWRAVVADIRAIPVAVPAPAPVRRVTRWRVPVGLAAGLLGVGTAALVVTGPAETRKPVAVAPAVKESLKSLTPRPVPPAVVAVAPAVPELAPAPRVHETAVVKVVPAVELAPVPRVRVSPDVVGGVTFAPPPTLVTVAARLPLVWPAADLDRPDVQARLGVELGRDAGYRLDLFAADPAKASAGLLAAVRSLGVTVGVDATLAERWKGKPAVAWAVYTESLSADDVRKLLAAVAANARGPAPAVSAAHLYPAGLPDNKDVTQLVGLDRGFGKRLKSGPARGVSAGTADQVAAALAKAGKTAVAVAYAPAAARVNPAASAEVQAFVKKAGDVRPGVVPLWVVVRPAG